MSVLPEEKDQELLINLGPQHPSTHGVLRIMTKVKGETVLSAESDVGYLHRCFEKIAEGWTYPQVSALTDRLDYVSAIANEWTFILAVEKLMGTQVPERAEYIRVIMGELQRINSHLLWLGAFSLDMGAVSPMLYTWVERERLADIFELVTGARMSYNFLRVGGVKKDLPPVFASMVEEALGEILKTVDEFDKLVLGNVIFQARTRGIGILKPETGIAFGASGAMIRGSGVARDIRKDEPYSIYPRFDFEVPVGTHGDVFDRCAVRVEEVRQSVRIIRQALQDLPEGEFRAKVPALLRPPAGEVYMATESPRGEQGVYLISDGSPKPYRVKWRAPSFVNLQLLDELSHGAKVADVVAILGSIDIILGEVDR